MSSEQKLLVVYSSKPYDELFFQPWLSQYASVGFKVEFTCSPLRENTIKFAQGASAICLFVNDKLTESMAKDLKQMGLELVLLRCAGTNNVDVEACQRAGLHVANVPAYGPNSVAEHALALILALNRKIHLVHDRVRAGDFSLNQSLLGFEMKGKTVGIVGTGRIGCALAEILAAMGCHVLCYDVVQDPVLKDKVEYVSLEDLLKRSKVVSLHVPLMESTHHMINAAALSSMPKGSLLINTSRGGLIDTQALIDSLKTKHLGGAALDVYEAESGQFYSDLSFEGIQDDVLARLTTFPNVLITCHQGYFTTEAMQIIAEVTFKNLKSFYKKD